MRGGVPAMHRRTTSGMDAAIACVYVRNSYDIASRSPALHPNPFRNGARARSSAA